VILPELSSHLRSVTLIGIYRFLFVVFYVHSGSVPVDFGDIDSLPFLFMWNMVVVAVSI